MHNHQLVDAFVHPFVHPTHPIHPIAIHVDTMGAFNLAFLIIFTAELLIKLIVLTPGGYFSDGYVRPLSTPYMYSRAAVELARPAFEVPKHAFHLLPLSPPCSTLQPSSPTLHASPNRFNTFDAIIVLLAYVEMAGDGGGAMSVLRMLRVLRILKMTKSMASFQSLIASVSDTLPSWGFLTFIMFLLW